MRLKQKQNCQFGDSSKTGNQECPSVIQIWHLEKNHSKSSTPEAHLWGHRPHELHGVSVSLPGNAPQNPGVVCAQFVAQRPGLKPVPVWTACRSLAGFCLRTKTTQRHGRTLLPELPVREWMDHHYNICKFLVYKRGVFFCVFICVVVDVGTAVWDIFWLNFQGWSIIFSRFLPQWLWISSVQHRGLHIQELINSFKPTTRILHLELNTTHTIQQWILST